MLDHPLVCRPPGCLPRLEAGSSKGWCRRPTCLLCAGYNGTHTASAGYPFFRGNSDPVPAPICTRWPDQTFP